MCVMTTIALVPAAGSGSRAGGPIPKQYQLLAGTPLILHTLRALLSVSAVQYVAVVLAADDTQFAPLAQALDSQRIRVLPVGGVTRADSVRNGLEALAWERSRTDWVLVHDAARPCVHPRDIETLLNTLSNDPVGGILAKPVADTIKRAESGAHIAETVPRHTLWAAQTPQMFRYGVLLDALRAHREVTDEAQAVERAGHAPRLIEAAWANPKVTYAEDFVIAEALLNARQS